MQIKPITSENINEIVNTDLYLRSIKRLLQDRNKIVEGFFLYDMRTDKPVGRELILYRSNKKYDNVTPFLLKNPKAWIFNVRISREYQNQGCARYMLQQTFKYLCNEKNIHQVHLAVAKNNLPALNLYKHAGGIIEAEKSSLKILKFAFPKHII